MRDNNISSKAENSNQKELGVLLDKAIRPSPAPLPEVETEPKEKLHKQPRGLLKTTAGSVARNKDDISLFSLQTYDESLQPSRETLSRNTGIAGQYLVALWQKNRDENGVYKINNLSEVAKPLNVSPQEFKNYLIYLSGFMYPVVKKESRGKGKKGILMITNSPLFEIKWRFFYEEGKDDKDYNKDKRVGTRLSNYIRDLPVESVEITPNQSFIEELEGEGLGNILVSDELIAFSLGLSDMAYKLFCLSGSNTPTTRISLKTLAGKRYLNLDRLMFGIHDKGKRIRAGKGKPYVLNKIKEALEELKQVGHLDSWNYEEKEEMFSWKYTDKLFKHRELYTLGDKVKTYNKSKTKKKGRENK